MNRAVPLWLVLLIVLTLCITAVGFGAAVKYSIDGREEHRGLVPRVALKVASFPGMVRSAVGEASAYVAGEYDRFVLVDIPRPDRPGLTPVRAAPHLPLRGLMIARGEGEIVRGWRVLVGTFDWDGRFRHGAVLISPDLEAIHFWALDEPPVGDNPAVPAHRRVPHGFAVLPDASAVFAFDGGKSLQKIDACSSQIWQEGGDYHHAVTLTEDRQHVWTLSGDALAMVNVETGQVARSIHLFDVIEANPEIDILEIRRLHDNDAFGNARDRNDPYLEDPFHLNDVDPLPSDIADAFPQFQAGDLLVSLRSPNLVMVVDPDTARVKWWRVGAWKRQHDPDWLPSGRIAVFDNQMNRQWSRIVEIEPRSLEVSVRLPGEPYDFYTRIRGKHQILPSGHHLVVSSQQSWAFEIGPDGKVALEFMNLKEAEPTLGYTMTDYQFLPEGALGTLPTCEPLPTAASQEPETKG